MNAGCRRGSTWPVLKRNQPLPSTTRIRIRAVLPQSDYHRVRSSSIISISTKCRVGAVISSHSCHVVRHCYYCYFIYVAEKCNYAMQEQRLPCPEACGVTGAVLVLVVKSGRLACSCTPLGVKTPTLRGLLGTATWCLMPFYDN